MLESLEHLDKYRIDENPFAAKPVNMVSTYLGSFIIGVPELTNEKFKVIASIDNGEWEHISLGASHINGRLPRAKEIEYIKNLFFKKSEANHIIMDIVIINCLHLWRHKNNPYADPPVPEYSRLVWLEQMLIEHYRQEAKNKKIKFV